jgi:hypothetical protein
MTAYAEQQKAADATWRHDRMVALLVACEDDCQQLAGQLCLNLRTGRPLEHQAAHARRIEDHRGAAASEAAGVHRPRHRVSGGGNATK